MEREKKENKKEFEVDRFQIEYLTSCLMSIRKISYDEAKKIAIKGM